MLKSSGLLFLCLLLSGCWSRIEIDDAAIVTALAADRGEEHAVRLTLYIARAGQTQAGGGGGDEAPGGREAPVWLASREGANLSDAMREIAQASPRRLSMHHLRVALIGEELARDGIDGFLDFLTRHPQIRLTTRVMTVAGRPASDVLAVQPMLEGLMSEQLADVLEAKGGPLQRLKEVAVAQVSLSHSPWMERIALIDRPVRREGTPQEEAYYDGVVLFKGGKLVEQLARREARAVNWLLGRPEQAILSVPCPGDPDKNFSGEILSSSVEIQPYLKGRSPAFRVVARGKVNLVRKPCMDVLVDPDTLRRYERTLSEDLAARLRRGIDKMQAAQADPAGFGKRFELRYPRYWHSIKEQWPELWQEASVKLDVQLDVSYGGLMIRPPLFDPEQPD